MGKFDILKQGLCSGAACAGLVFTACAPSTPATDTAQTQQAETKAKPMPEWTDLSKREKPDPVVQGGWKSVVISVPDMDVFAKLFTEIGGYETVSRDDQNWILRAQKTTDGYIELWKNDNPDAVPARPLDAKAWDTGCYWSIMMRAKNIPSIVKDAKRLGWEPLTEIAYLEFGPSKLNVVVLRHQVTGAQIQLYERLTTPLPENFPEFERISRPFNIMQMVKDRDVTYDFFQQKLGFETFYYGKPYTSPEPENMPLGIPAELTTKVPYKAAIVYPEKGMEWGRFEMIEIDGDKHGLNARDFSARCTSENWGTISVTYSTEMIEPVREALQARGHSEMSPIIVQPLTDDDIMNREFAVWNNQGAFIMFKDSH